MDVLAVVDDDRRPVILHVAGLDHGPGAGAKTGVPRAARMSMPAWNSRCFNQGECR
jgi:hypothetical protein